MCRLTGRAGGAKHSRFTFDAVFGPTASQDDVYTEAAPVVTSVLDGYHVCMFAYGELHSDAVSYHPHELAEVASRFCCYKKVENYNMPAPALILVPLSRCDRSSL